MTGHAKRAQLLWDKMTNDEFVLINDLPDHGWFSINKVTALVLFADALTQAHAAGRREGLEEAATIAESFAITPTDYIRDADTCFDIAMKIRAKAKEAGHE